MNEFSYKVETGHYGKTLVTHIGYSWERGYDGQCHAADNALHMQQYNEYTLGECSRVIVKQLTNEQIAIAQHGIIAHDYTAAME